MDLDVYQPCPCGSGKKIKFCCCSDLLPELDKLIRTLQANQHVAALDQIVRLTSTKGPRAALQLLKADIHLGMGDIERAGEAVKPLIDVMPANPIVLFHKGLLALAQDSLEQAFDAFQDGVANTQGESLPAVGSNLFSALISTLFSHGQVLTARALVTWRMVVSGFDPEIVEKFRAIERQLNTSLLFRYPFDFTLPAANSPNYAAISAAFKEAIKGSWRRSADQLESIVKKLTDAERPVVYRSIARLRGWLFDEEAAAQAWLRYASCPGIPEEEAVEAEAVALLFSENDGANEIDDIKLTIPINDIDRLMERCLSNPRIARGTSDPEEMVEEGQPPPKMVFVLLSKPRPAANVPVSIDTTPIANGVLSIFGRETDQNARLEFITSRTPELLSNLNSLSEIAGDSLGTFDVNSAEVLASAPEFEYLLNAQFFLPDVTVDQLLEVTRENRIRVLRDRWAALPHNDLNGKTPLQVAGNSDYRQRLKAILLNLEVMVWQTRWKFDVNELRRKLAVPEMRKLAFDQGQLFTRPLVRIPRIELSILPTDSVIEVLDLSNLFALDKTIYEAAAELLQRDLSQTKRPVKKLELLTRLMESAPDATAAIEHAQEAQKEAISNRQSPGPWLVNELSLRLQRMEIEKAQSIISTLTTKHRNEKDVMQILYQVLKRYGLINNQTQPGAAPPPGAPPSPTAPSQLWTPDQSPGTPAGTGTGGQKSKLWVPGMD